MKTFFFAAAMMLAQLSQASLADGEANGLGLNTGLGLRSGLNAGLNAKDINVGSDRVGNGGIGVRLETEAGPKIYLLDLYRRKIHLDPYFKYTEDRQDQQVWVHRFQDHFSKMGQGLADARQKEILSLLANKIFEVSEYSPTWAYLLRSVILKLNWNFDQQELYLSEHSNNTVSDQKSDLIPVPLARRQGKQVDVDLGELAMMDVKQIVALILHEATFTLVKPKEVFVPTIQESITIQMSTQAMEMTATYFTAADPGQDAYRPEDFHKLIEEHMGITLPTIFDLKKEFDVHSTFYWRAQGDHDFSEWDYKEVSGKKSYVNVYPFTKIHDGALVFGLAHAVEYVSVGTLGGIARIEKRTLGYFRIKLEDIDIHFRDLTLWSDDLPQGLPSPSKIGIDFVKEGDEVNSLLSINYEPLKSEILEKGRRLVNESRSIHDPKAY